MNRPVKPSLTGCSLFLVGSAVLVSSLDDRISALVTLNALSFDALVIVALAFSVVIGTRGATNLAKRKFGRLDHLFVSLYVTLLFGLIGAVATLTTPLLGIEIEAARFVFLIHLVGLVPIVSCAFIYKATERRLLSGGADFVSLVQAGLAFSILIACSMMLMTLLSIDPVFISARMSEFVLISEILALAGIVSIGRTMMNLGLRRALVRVMAGLVLLFVADLSLIVATAYSLLPDLNPVVSLQVLSSLFIVSGMALYQGVQSGKVERRNCAGDAGLMIARANFDG